MRLPLLRIAALSFPFASVHSCINGYFYGVRKTGVPAATQLTEQLFRVGKRLPYRFHVHKGGKGAYHRGCRSRSRHWRAFLHASCPSRSIPSFVKKAYPGGRPPSGTLHRKTTGSGPARLVQAYGRLSRQILGFAAPLSANRLCLNVLQAIEAACIPAKRRFTAIRSVIP